MDNYEAEWCEDAAVSRAMERLTPFIQQCDEREVETILQLLWNDGCAWGYNYG